ncbi:SGNH/GDSL hydrolase family protein [Phenylobacterium sp.]|uniref:SGNH/GDSL hydrolase family protein n=1 Tax=Phenylobacterium sp. TaxID=1871053 RepID=UPI002FE2B2B9
MHPTRRTAMSGMLRVGAALALAVSLGGAGPAPGRWVGAWAASQQIPEPHNALDPAELTEATLRQVVRVTAGGPQIRVRLSNAFGTEPLRFRAVHVARPVAVGSPRIDPATDRAVTFGGRRDVTVPAGADYLSDPVTFAVRPLERIAVSVELPEAPARQTSHPGSRTTSWTLRGRHAAAADLPGAKGVAHWYQLSGVDVPAARRSGAIVTFGDSITDGYGVGPDRDERWPDFLAERLQADPRTRHLSVLNHGIGGNRLLRDGTGPNALARFDRDVLAQTGVTHLVILEGVNDLGVLTRDGPASADAQAAMVQDLTGAYRQMIARARVRGIKVIGATIMPFAGSGYYHPPPATESSRQAVNAWIRAPGNFDAVIDFDAVMRDPARPDRLRAEYDVGDGLHPSIAGYRAMAAAVPLSLFIR